MDAKTLLLSKLNLGAFKGEKKLLRRERGVPDR